MSSAASMMYFSDADADLARYSRIDEQKLRNQLRLKLEANVSHQLMAKFDVVSLISATSLNGEQDLKHIYQVLKYVHYHQSQTQDNKLFLSFFDVQNL